MKNAMQLKAIMKKLAKENQISAQLVLQNYMLERFLERVSLSPYRDNYIIKGGFLISSMVGLNSRATMDMDATIKGYPVTQDTVQKMIEKILTVPVDDDITFTFKSIGEIREGDEYTGYRVALTADFPPMAVPLKLDITTGDKITPREIQYDYKLMLEDRHIQVMAYNLATILAEKLETVISRSDQNTRPRDYYDVYMQRIQDTFWTMHEITYEVEEVDITPEPTEDDPDPEQQTDYILHITVSSKTVDELAELYNFTQDQNDILHELLSDEMRPTLLALCGGIGIIEDGELCWPLPGHTYISCNFGDDDAYGNSGHRGTDIPAPEGTPILAAHSGTVIISGWNNSYGNQVLLDNGAGLSTRYAHMTQTAVAAGEAVTAGQVIGYVGNTGDSTGFHLHFEVMQNGVRVNPLDAVTPQ